VRLCYDARNEVVMAATASAVPNLRYASLESSAEPATSSWTFT